MRIGSGGRVGIGTTDPYGNLSVFMGTTAPQDSFYYDNVNMLQIGEASARGLAGLFAKRSTYAGASGYNGDLAFYNLFYAGAADYQWKERMRIQANGNVGIGTTSPTAKLDVSGTIKSTGVATLQTVLSKTGNTGSVATATATTLFALVGDYEESYIVNASLHTADTVNYFAVSIVVNSDTARSITALRTAGALTITLSGGNVQATQSSGGNATIYWNATRLS
jgi:hypothetical protein